MAHPAEGERFIRRLMAMKNPLSTCMASRSL